MLAPFASLIKTHRGAFSSHEVLITEASPELHLT